MSVVIALTACSPRPPTGPIVAAYDEAIRSDRVAQLDLSRAVARIIPIGASEALATARLRREGFHVSNIDSPTAGRKLFATRFGGGWGRKAFEYRIVLTTAEGRVSEVWARAFYQAP